MTDSEPHIGARRDLYRLLARLYLTPIDATRVAELRGLPGFAEHLPQAPALDGWLDELAVEYERLFGRNIYPYESIFRDRELMLNTAAADRIAGLYRAYDVELDWTQAGVPDHLAVELNCMAELLEREALALARGDGDAARRARSVQARYLREHLVNWAPICALTLARIAEHPLYVALATLTNELVLSDLAALPSEPTSNVQAAIPLLARDDVEDERGLGQVVRRLITPVDAGLLLTRADLSALGRAGGLPVTIGDREQMLRSLFESAGQFEQILVLLGALQELFEAVDRELVALMHDHPAWEAYGLLWRTRLSTSQAMLQELRIQAVELDPSR